MDILLKRPTTERLLYSEHDTESGCIFLSLHVGDLYPYRIKYVCPGMRDYLKYRSMHEASKLSTKDACH